MRNLLILAAIGFTIYYYQQSILSFVGFGAGLYGISEESPLGTLEKFTNTLENNKFSQSEDASGIVFTSEFDQKHDSMFSNSISLKADEDGNITSVTGVFVGSQHGMSPQRPTMVEQIMTDLWKIFNRKPKFKQINDGTISMPYGMHLSQSHMEATFDEDGVSGLWGYEDRNPYEVITLTVN